MNSLTFLPPHCEGKRFSQRGFLEALATLTRPPLDPPEPEAPFEGSKRAPKRSQEGPKRSPRGPQHVCRRLQEGPTKRPRPFIPNHPVVLGPRFEETAPR
eukprot:3128962-Pyramimonas_sp.AAC.1